MWMYTSNGTVWYPFCPLWWGIACFRDEKFGCKWPLHTSCENSTIPTLISEGLLHKWNQHHNVNLHIKWNCLIPILSTLAKYCLFQGWKELPPWTTLMSLRQNWCPPEWGTMSSKEKDTKPNHTNVPQAEFMSLRVRDIVPREKWPLHISHENLTIPTLIWEGLFHKWNQHHNVNVHTKWNCLVPILSTLAKYCMFHGWKG